jgi:hypothetical protein
VKLYFFNQVLLCGISHSVAANLACATLTGSLHCENRKPGVVVVSKALLDLTNAYLAIEGLIQSRVLSAETHQQLKVTLEFLNKESERLMEEHTNHVPKAS